MAMRNLAGRTAAAAAHRPADCIAGAVIDFPPPKPVTPPRGTPPAPAPTAH